MKNKNVVIILLLLLFAVNPLELYYNSNVPSIQQQKEYLDSEVSLLNMDGYKEEHREIFRNKTYIVVLKARDDIESNMENIKSKFQNNGQSFLQQRNNIRENRDQTKIILFEKEGYKAKIEFFEKNIVMRFWHKNYYER